MAAHHTRKTHVPAPLACTLLRQSRRPARIFSGAFATRHASCLPAVPARERETSFPGTRLACRLVSFFASRPSFCSFLVFSHFFRLRVFWPQRFHLRQTRNKAARAPKASPSGGPRGGPSLFHKSFHTSHFSKKQKPFFLREFVIPFTHHSSSHPSFVIFRDHASYHVWIILSHDTSYIIFPVIFPSAEAAPGPRPGPRTRSSRKTCHPPRVLLQESPTLGVCGATPSVGSRCR